MKRFSFFLAYFLSSLASGQNQNLNSFLESQLAKLKATVSPIEGINFRTEEMPKNTNDGLGQKRLSDKKMFIFSEADLPSGISKENIYVAIPRENCLLLIEAKKNNSISILGYEYTWNSGDYATCFTSRNNERPSVINFNQSQFFNILGEVRNKMKELGINLSSALDNFNDLIKIQCTFDGTGESNYTFGGGGTHYVYSQEEQTFLKNFYCKIPLTVVSQKLEKIDFEKLKEERRYFDEH